MKRAKDDSVTFRIRKSLKDRIELLASFEDRSVSNTIGKSVEAWVESAEQFYRDNADAWQAIEELRAKDCGVQSAPPKRRAVAKSKRLGKT